MTQDVVFEVRGFNKWSAFAYISLGTFFIIVVIYLFLGTINTDYFVLIPSPGTIYFLLFTACAILSFYAAYLALIPKRIVFDGKYLSLFHRNTLKRKIIFTDIYKVIKSGYMNIRVPIFITIISIYYRNNDKKKVIKLRGDEYSPDELKILVELFERFANHDDFYIEDQVK
jgi:hypothetical protein